MLIFINQTLQPYVCKENKYRSFLSFPSRLRYSKKNDLERKLSLRYTEPNTMPSVRLMGSI
jgi:hypothetical protein